MDGYYGDYPKIELVLDLRSRAAIAAMQGLLAGEGAVALMVSDEERSMMIQRSPEETARLAVRHADALLEALS
jgi:hypothetical protein